MKLIMICTGLKTGGAEMMLYKLLGYLSRGNMVLVISLTDKGDIGQRIEGLNVQVETLGMTYSFSSVFKLIQLVCRLKQLQPDCVTTWLYHADLIGGIAASIAGVPAIVWNIRNGCLEIGGTKTLTRAVMRVCSWLSHFIPDRIICCSHMAKDLHIRQGYHKAKFVLIPNGFDILRFRSDQEARRQVRMEMKIPQEAAVVGLIARFHPQKGHRIFFQAAGELHRRRPDTFFLLAGDRVEPSNPALMDWISEAGISDCTRLLGVRRDAARLTCSLDIAVSAAVYGEAFSNAIGEAMACEVPCVVTDMGDSAFIVGNTGRVIPPADPNAMAIALEDLLSMPERRRREIGRLARKRVIDHFEIGRIAEQYKELYRETAGRN